MKEQLITLETAKIAKEKGFEFIGNYYHINDGYKLGYALCYSNSDSKENCLVPAPTQSLLQEWLRKFHNIYVTALPFRDIEDEIELCFYFSLVEDSEELDDILCNETHLGASDSNYDTYEEALEKGLQEALKLIK